MAKRSLIVSFLAVSLIAAGQPAISPHGIVNAGSLMAPGLPGGSIAQGSLFSIYGSKLGPSTPAQAAAYPLATTFGGVSVAVTQATASGSTTVNAIPYYVSATQINAIMPSNAPLGRVSIQVTNSGQKGAVSPATIVATSVGLLAANSGGFGPGVIQDALSGGQLPVNTGAAPAIPGQIAVLYATGLGPIATSDTVAPASGNLSAPVEVFVGGVSAAVAYHGRVSCCSGLDQINITVPNNAPLGCWVPVQVRTNGTQMSNTVTMAISPTGGACADINNALSQPFRAGSKLGVISLLHDDTTEDVGQTAPKNVTTDSVMMTFQKEAPAGVGPFHPVFSLPPAGTCTSYTTPGDLFDGDPFPGLATSGSFLNAGTPLTLAGGGGPAKNMARPTTNERNFQPLGYTYTGSLVPSSLVLNPGSFTVNGPGGPDVGAFTANVNFPAGLTWTNRDQTLTIDRTKGFTVNWSGQPAGHTAIIFGGNVDLPSNATSLFVCVSAGNGSFTIPAIALGNVAPTRTNLLQSKGAVYVGSLPIASPPAFSATGLDFGALLPGSFIGKTVIFQ